MIAVNLFDDTFRHAPGSVGYKVPRHVQFVRDRMTWDGITIFTEGYLRRPIVDQVQSRYKIGWLHEAPCLHPEDYQDIPVDKFDCILTYAAGLLARGAPFRYAPRGGVSLPREVWGLHDKTKLVSMIASNKNVTEGHRLRAGIAAALEGKVDFYGVRGLVTGYGWQVKQAALADYAFNVVTEGCQLDYLFTEWILDCMAVGTIPIYWGCPSLSMFFDARGVLAFDAKEQALDVVDNLSFDLYRSLLPYAATNLAAIGEYEITEDWICQNVLGDYA